MNKERIYTYIGKLRGFIESGEKENALSILEVFKDYLLDQTAGTMAEEYERTINKVIDDMNEKKSSADLEENPVHPVHYQSYNTNIKIECIDAMRAAFGDEATAIFCKLNAFKYNWRSSSKGLNTDISKAIWYLNKFLELGGHNL